MSRGYSSLSSVREEFLPVSVVSCSMGATKMRMIEREIMMMIILIKMMDV